MRGRSRPTPRRSAGCSATPPCSSRLATPLPLAAALLRLADDRETLLKLRHAARQLAAEQFAPEQIVEPLVARLG